jgi:hypothetical protein
MSEQEFIDTLVTIYSMNDPDTLKTFIEIHKDVWYNIIKSMGLLS